MNTMATHAASPTLPVEDIQVGEENGEFSMLITLKAQPTAATTKATEIGFDLFLKDIALKPMDVSLPAHELVSRAHIETQNSDTSRLVFKTQRLVNLKTQIFKNAVLVTAEMPHKIVKRQQPKASEFLEIAGLTASECFAAEARIKADAWDLDFLSAYANCMIDRNNYDEARSAASRAVSINPSDWRAMLAIAELDARTGDPAKAEIGFSETIKLAQEPDIKQRIGEWMHKPR